MQTTANISLVLTGVSSLKRSADLKTAISYGGFYQQLALELVSGVLTNEVLQGLGNRLVLLAEQAHAFRKSDILEQMSQILMTAPLSNEYEAIGLYYKALSIHRLGRGDTEQAARLLEQSAENAPCRYRVRAMISLGSDSLQKGDNQAALSLYRGAARFVSSNNVGDLYSTVHTHKMIATLSGEEGNHRGALSLLEKLFPLAHHIRTLQPHVYYDYMNSLAVELCEVGRLEEARNVSRIVLASPFAPAYPEWRETSTEIALRGRRASRATVAVTQKISETDIEGNDAQLAVEACAVTAQATTEASNVITLPSVRLDVRREALEAGGQSIPARVIDFPSRTTMSEQNDKDELGLNEKRRIVADELYEMFMATLEDAPIDNELVDELYRVFLKKRKKG